MPGRSARRDKRRRRLRRATRTAQRAPAAVHILQPRTFLATTYMLGLDSIFLPAFRLVYRRRRPQPVGRRAPRLTWLPKFETSVHIPDEVLDAPDPHEALEARLAALGFSIDHWTRDELVLGRGKRWGDFSIKLIRLHAAFALPLRAETTMMVKVADVCLFDTGDTWKLTRDLKAAIEEGASGQGRPPES